MFASHCCDSILGTCTQLPSTEPHEEERAVTDSLDGTVSVCNIGSSALLKGNDDVLQSYHDISEDEELEDTHKDTDWRLVEATGLRSLRHIEKPKQEDVEDDSDSSSLSEDDEAIKASILAMMSRTRLAVAPRLGTRYAGMRM